MKKKEIIGVPLCWLCAAFGLIAVITSVYFFMHKKKYVALQAILAPILSAILTILTIYLMSLILPLYIQENPAYAVLIPFLGISPILSVLIIRFIFNVIKSKREKGDYK